jgi:acyl-CoA synthetase (AMP-forming)/AMP-acid ligase II
MTSNPIQPDIAAADPSWQTLAELIADRVQQAPDLELYSFLIDGERQRVLLSCAALARRVNSVAAWLLASTRPGDRVLIQTPPGLDFVVAFLGCVGCGRIAVPVFPPQMQRKQRGTDRWQSIFDSAEPAAALTTQPAANPAHELAVPYLEVDRHASSDAPDALLGCDVRPDMPAMIQYTSGSTTAPRGVVLTHRNLLHNLAHICRRFGHTSASRGVIWLPPYHDMGLIGGILQPIYAGFPVLLMSPLHFLQQPVRWLRAISEFGGTTSGGPNFAYEMCAQQITPEDCAGLDLSRWEVAFVGAEPVAAKTLDRFAAAFEPYGFRRQALYPCYGLAEGTLLVSGANKLRGVAIQNVSVDELESNRFKPLSPGDAAGRQLVGCGHSLDDQTILVVDPDTMRPVKNDQIGEIWVRGPSVASGYWNSPQATEATFGAILADTGEGPFLRTGDLGYLCDGQLFITGRLKDLIILAGRNHYPQDIEQTVQQCHSAIRRDGCAAFGIEMDGEEQLVVVAEVRRRADLRQGITDDWRLDSEAEGIEQSPEIVAAIRSAVFQQHGARVASVQLVSAASILKTPSGKKRRQACRAKYLAECAKQVV